MTLLQTLAVWLTAFLLVAATVVAVTANAQHKAASLDEAITAEVEKAIFSDASLKTMDISVQTRDGVVHLRGIVNSTGDIARAAALARTVKGVSSLRNSIRIAERSWRA
jgi:osmotically-inducible protein OsmY